MIGNRRLFVTFSHIHQNIASVSKYKLPQTFFNSKKRAEIKELYDVFCRKCAVIRLWVI